MVAAFDYRRRIAEDGIRPRLLHLAHRVEILEQAIATFRNAMRDGAFGAVMTEGKEPTTPERPPLRQIQSFDSRDMLPRFGANYRDHVVIDECHHAARGVRIGPSWRGSARALVGLTATPERTGGHSSCCPTSRGTSRPS